MSSSHFRGPDIHKALENFRPSTSVLKIIEAALQRNGHDVALIEGDTGEKVTFFQLLHQSCRIAAGLQRAGASPGDIVVLCCEKSILAYSLFLGVIFTGATAVLAPPPHADTIDKLISGQQVKALFYDSTLSESVSQSVARMTPPPSLLGTIDKADSTIASLLNCTEDFSVFQVEDVTKHVPVVYFSSGTTGQPKGIEISDLGFHLGGALFQHKPKSLLHASPLYWYSALCTFMMSIHNSYPLILTNKKGASNRLQLIEKYKVDSFFSNIANMIEYVNEYTTLEKFDISTAKRVIIGGETVLPSVARQFFTKVLGGRATFLVVYASTEAGLISEFDVRDVQAIKLGACGKAYPGVEIKILDDHGNTVEPGVMGNIWVKTLATKGYWRNEELNRNFLDGEGFYDTGDAGIMDDEGNLYLRGRICDLINFRGIKNSPAILEDLLMAHPAVQDVAVIGRPHPDDVQHPTAFVVLRPEYQGTITERNIVAYVDDRVEDSMRLRGGVHFRDSLPRVSNGKVIRKML